MKTFDCHNGATSAWISVGANLMNPLTTCRAAVAGLRHDPHISLKTVSRWYRTSPMGSLSQPWYINGALVITTDLAPKALLACLNAWERCFGRDRQHEQIRWGPRTLDLDLLMYGDRGECILNTLELTLPHPEMAERLFVVQPLAEIAPQLRHPVLDRTIEEIRHDRMLDTNQQIEPLHQ